MNTNSALKTTKIIELEYLRGIAVFLIFIFHLKLLKVGFIGVDIFFLISGYFITNHLINKKINYKNIFIYYIKRLNRILPTLTLVVLTTILIVLYFFPLKSNEFGEVLRQGFHSLIFISNYFFFLSDINYFNEEFSDFFLHTWSLSIEMQIYFFFPFISFFLVKIKNENNFIFLVCASVFIYFICTFQKDQNFIGSYYSTIIRFFEFFFGSLFFLYENKFNKKKYYIYVAILVIFLALTFFSFFLKFIDKNFFLTSCSVFLTIIFFKFKDKTYLIFKSFFTNLGKISYSFYLWHLPVIFFSLVIFNNKIYFFISAFFITFILSTLSFYFVEKKSVFKDGKFYKIYFIICVLFSISIFLYILTNALNAKLKKKEYNFFNETQIQEIEKFSNDNNFISKKIKKIYDISNFSKYVKIGKSCRKENYEINKCTFLLNNKLENLFLLTGDSHADSIIPTLYNSKIISKLIIDINTGRHFSKDIIRITGSEKGNFEDIIVKMKKKNMNIYQRVLNNFKSENNHKNKYLVIHNRNLFYINKNDNYIINDNLNNVSKKQLNKLNMSEYLKYHSKELVQLTKLMNKNEKIIYIIPIIDPQFSLKECLFKNKTTSLKNCYYLNNSKDIISFERTLRKIEESSDKLILINLNDAICKKNQENCSFISDDNKLIFQDSNHLSKDFSEKLSVQFDKLVMDKLN